jgi:hypothetical protein
MKQRTLSKYSDGGNVPKKPKYSLKMNTERIASDNTSSYTKPYKTVNERPIEPMSFFDPTGVSNYPELMQAYNEGRYKDLPIELLGSLPMIGKFGKVMSTLKTKRNVPIGRFLPLIDDANEIIKYQDGGQIMKQKTLPEYKKGGMIKRADGSYSKRGLWDNVRANAGSGKKPTKEMLKQERKIKAKMEEGGVIDNPGFNALPKEVQENIIANMAMGGYIYSEGGNIHIKPENKGKFTSWAESHGMGVQEAASHVMANKEDYSSTIVKRANFAKNASKWKHQDGGTINRSLNQYSQGGNMTGPIQLGAMVGELALGAIPDNQVTDTEGNAVGTYQSTGKSIGQGALKGAAAGSMFGPVGTVVGGLAGGAMGYFQGKEEENEVKKMQADANNIIMSKRRIGGPNSPITTMPTNVNNMYPYGGTINDDQPGAIAELELQEQMQLPNGTVMGVDGPSHEQGGIEVNVPEGTRVFSDRLKNGKRTFAQDAKSINSKIAKLDKKPDSQAKSNTEMLFNKQLDNLFNTQEEMKIVKEQKRMFSKGGTIPPAHNGMYPAHNVRIMRHGGLMHYDGENGNGVIFSDPAVVITDPLAQYKWGMENKNSNLFPSQPNQVVADNYGVQRPSVTKGTQSFRQSEPNNTNSNYFTPQNMGYVSQGLTNLIQNQQINKVKAPRSIAPVTFSAGRSPEYVDYSAERAAIDAEIAAARRGLNLGSGSYSTQAANLQKIRNQQMMGKGRSFQTQENANKQLNNAYSGAQAAAYNQGVSSNLGIDQYNLENRQNYELWKAGNRMKSTGAMGDNMTNMFNNQIAKENQLAYYEMMSRMYEDKIRKDIAVKKYGGTIKKRSLKK